MGLFNSTNCINTAFEEWSLVISAGESGTCVQISFDLFDNNNMKARYCAAGIWSNWKYQRNSTRLYDKDQSNAIEFLYESDTLIIAIDGIRVISLPRNMS